MTEKSILIVNYYFPPFHRVGGRRWAKFAKYLFRRGWDVHVVAGDFPGSVSPWDKDTELYRDRIHRVSRKPLPLPFFKQKLPTNPIEKIRWKLSQWFFEFYTKKNYVGDYTDPSYLDGPAFAVAVRNVLTANPQIKNVIVSVGPYYYAMDVLKLKRDFPIVRFWLDYRDEWIIWNGLTVKQQQDLSDFKVKLNQLAEACTSVNDIITNELINNFKKLSFTIPHAFDDDDFVGFENLNPNPKKLQFVYGGDLYPGFEHRVNLLSNLLNSLNQQGIEAEAIIYADKRKHPYQKWNNVMFKEPLGLDDFFKVIKKSDFSLILRGTKPVNQFSTKVFELIKLGRPILVIDDSSPELDFIEQNKLGFGLTADSSIEQLTEAIISQKSEKTLPAPYNLKPHSIDYTFEMLCNLLIKQL